MGRDKVANSSKWQLDTESGWGLNVDDDDGDDGSPKIDLV